MLLIQNIVYIRTCYKEKHNRKRYTNTDKYEGDTCLILLVSLGFLLFFNYPCTKESVSLFVCFIFSNNTCLRFKETAPELIKQQVIKCEYRTNIFSSKSLLFLLQTLRNSKYLTGTTINTYHQTTTAHPQHMQFYFCILSFAFCFVDIAEEIQKFVVNGYSRFMNILIIIVNTCDMNQFLADTATIWPNLNPINIKIFKINAWLPQQGILCHNQPPILAIIMFCLIFEKLSTKWKIFHRLIVSTNASVNIFIIMNVIR